MSVVSTDVSEQYRSRDMRGSKVFRKAVELFGESSIVRKRVFNPSPNDSAFEEQTLRPSSLATSVYAKPRVFPRKEKKLTTENAGETELDEYHKWLEQRKVMRAQLEQLGNMEKWLTGKECTPSERKLLNSLQPHNVRASTATLEDEIQVSSEDDGLSSRKSTGKRKPILLTKCPTPQAIFKMEEYIVRHRLRLIDMFARADKNKDWLISCSECRQVFKELQVPITDSEIDELMGALDINNDGSLDYRELLKGRLAYRLEKRQRKKTPGKCSPRVTIQPPQLASMLDENISIADTDSTASADSEIGQQRRDRTKSIQKKRIKSPESMQSTRIKQHVAPSTLNEPTAQRVENYRQEELKQFENLLLYCRTHGIVLNQSLLERALLLPGDQDCARKLKQPRQTLLSSHFADPPVEEEELSGNLWLIECFGGPYLQLRGPRKGQTVKLTTGTAHIKSKTDCWLTFEEYRQLTQLSYYVDNSLCYNVNPSRHIKSRFPFKYHGIPDDSVFWPGHILHKMRLCMPPYNEYKDDKVASVKNIFQPVRSVQASVLPVIPPRVVWPTNEAGYIQSGDNGRKSYAL